MKHILMVIVLLVSAQATADSGDCNIRFYISDKDEGGTNVRSAPNGDVIFRISKTKVTDHYVYVSQLKDGWWKVEKINHETGAQILLSNAWIHQSVIGTGLDDGEVMTDEKYNSWLITPIYSKPTYKSKSGKYMMMGGETQILECAGMWLKIRHTFDGKSVDGWWAPEDQCASTVTNCANGSSGEETGTDIWGNQ